MLVCLRENALVWSLARFSLIIGTYHFNHQKIVYKTVANTGSM
jgi:hypothetical protein